MIKKEICVTPLTLNNSEVDSALQLTKQKRVLVFHLSKQYRIDLRLLFSLHEIYMGIFSVKYTFIQAAF